MATDDAFSLGLARAVRNARQARQLSVAVLADRAQVSRAMVGKIERGDVQPTAALLGRLSGALGMTLSELVARAEGGDTGRLMRVADQPVWVDPETGYQRRAVSPASGSPLQLVEVELPPGATVSMPAETFVFIHPQIWVLSGSLRFRLGDVDHLLEAGDCLQLGPPAPCASINDTDRTCRYLIALTKTAP
jgi:transcriptional regulator with XRE-family HTH domain